MLSHIVKRKPAPAGLDCGQAWAKLVRLQRTRKGLELDRVGRMPWLRGDRNQPERMASALQNLHSSLDVHSQAVITSLAGHSVIIKRLTLPLEQIKNLDQNIASLATQHIPFDVHDVCLDYQPLLSEDNQQHDPQTVLLVASKKKMVDEMQKVMTQAGLRPQVIDVDGFALCNCFELNYPEAKQATVALVDIGSSQSTFCVVDKHSPVFVRDASFGGQQVTDRVASILDVSTREAEKLKWQDEANLDPAQKNAMEPEINAVFIDWSEEIQRLLHYYTSAFHAAPKPEKFYISGGGSLHPGLQAVLAEQLESEIIFLDPWRECSIDDSMFDQGYLRSIGPQYAVATGLALRAVM